MCSSVCIESRGWEKGGLEERKGRERKELNKTKALMTVGFRWLLPRG
jgi:hypothetical protein